MFALKMLYSTSDSYAIFCVPVFFLDVGEYKQVLCVQIAPVTCQIGSA